MGINLPLIWAFTVLAVQGTVTALLERTAREARLVGGNASRGLSSILSILVVLVEADTRVAGELKVFSGVRGGLGRVLMTRAHDNLLGPFGSLGC
jgi:hypothetical protein